MITRLFLLYILFCFTRITMAQEMPAIQVNNKTVYHFQFKIITVVDENNILADFFNDGWAWIELNNTDGLVDDTMVEALLFYEGTKSYETVLHAKKTVRAYRELNAEEKYIYTTNKLKRETALENKRLKEREQEILVEKLLLEKQEREDEEIIKNLNIINLTNSISITLVSGKRIEATKVFIDTGVNTIRFFTKTGIVEIGKERAVENALTRIKSDIVKYINSNTNVQQIIYKKESPSSPTYEERMNEQRRIEQERRYRANKIERDRFKGPDDFKKRK